MTKPKWTDQQVFDHVKKLPSFKGFDPSKLWEFVQKIISNPLFQMLLALLMKQPVPTGLGAAAHKEDAVSAAIYAAVMSADGEKHLAECAPPK